MKFKFFTVLLISGLATACFSLGVTQATETQPEAQVATATVSGEVGGSRGLQAQAVQTRVVLNQLRGPWAVTTSPRQEVWVLELSGRIKIYDSDFNLMREYSGFPNLRPTGQGGLLDVAFHPQYLTNQLVYLVYTVLNPATDRYHARVMRFKEVGGSLVEPLKIIDGAEGGDSAHFGSRLVFDRQGLLYASFGDRHTPERVQDRSTMFGKIVRLNDDGSVPQDNPFPGSPIFTLGHRNPQGLTIHPVTGQLFNAEHGPTGYDGPSGGDELNALVPGGNYGWPEASHDLTRPERRKPGMISPIAEYTPAVAPSGIAFYTGDRIPAWKNDLFVATLRGSALRRVRLSAQGAVVEQEELFRNQFGRIRDVGTSPSGTLLFVTDNGQLVEVTAAP